MRDLDPKQMKLPNGHTLHVHNRAARWQRIRIDRRHRRIEQAVSYINFLTGLCGLYMGYLVFFR
jgi:hypothetical protein